MRNHLCTCSQCLKNLKKGPFSDSILAPLISVQDSMLSLLLQLPLPLARQPGKEAGKQTCLKWKEKQES